MAKRNRKVATKEVTPKEVSKVTPEDKSKVNTVADIVLSEDTESVDLTRVNLKDVEDSTKKSLAQKSTGPKKTEVAKEETKEVKPKNSPKAKVHIQSIRPFIKRS